jgi:hypothetical protein
MPVPFPLSILADLPTSEQPSIARMTSLGLGFARDLWDVPAGVDGNHLQLQHIKLFGLAQGPQAATAASLEVPDVWTVLLWAVNR